MKGTAHRLPELVDTDRRSPGQEDSCPLVYRVYDRLELSAESIYLLSSNTIYAIRRAPLLETTRLDVWVVDCGGYKRRFRDESSFDFRFIVTLGRLYCDYLHNGRKSTPVGEILAGHQISHLQPHYLKGDWRLMGCN